VPSLLEVTEEPTDAGPAGPPAVQDRPAHRPQMVVVLQPRQPTPPRRGRDFLAELWFGAQCLQPRILGAHVELSAR